MITKLAAGRTDQDTAESGLHKLVARAWNDPAFKARLVAEPTAALATAGIAVPTGVTLKVVEDTNKLMHLVLPPTPAEEEISDEALDKVAGGGCGCLCWGWIDRLLRKDPPPPPPPPPR